MAGVFHKKKLVNVFKRHFRVSGSKKPNYRTLEDERNFGFGLGLSIVRQLVILQGARIDVEKAHLDVTEFTIWFPPDTHDDEKRLKNDKVDDGYRYIRVYCIWALPTWLVCF